MPHPPTPLVGKAGVYIPLLSISFIRFYFTSFFFYFEGWFKGMSNLFLSCPVPKLLILAGN